ncbi:hypothetical protein ES288_A11G286100v1 [Gossypium darwinii]|uniref:Uncharacterized protein n=1 Tax=Gossypium darwinii TaxID=34276 RepID=A0A5D2EPT8_GOSDA|nr:hypothetical protein ES288_A11G286100v1 [Gossypium darwinii]
MTRFGCHLLESKEFDIFQYIPLSLLNTLRRQPTTALHLTVSKGFNWYMLNEGKGDDEHGITCGIEGRFQGLVFNGNIIAQPKNGFAYEPWA